MPTTGNWERAWRDGIGARVDEVVRVAQEASAATADAYVADVLAELDIESSVSTSLNIDALVGVAGDGRPVDSLAYGAVIHSAQAQYAPDLASLSTEQASSRALASGAVWLEQVVAGLLADTARTASQASTAQRTWVTGYVRMVNPGACSRCVVLAGKFYKYNTGFSRHEPTCRCTHIPASEDVAGDLLTSPDRYFESLSKEEQDRIFTNAGAEAIRMGADMNQVVNARRGMHTAQVGITGGYGRKAAVDVYGRSVFITREGITARGLSGKRLGNLASEKGQRYSASRTPRLMPETILAEAKSPEDALRLLKRFGYVL